MSVAARFWSKVDRSGECWRWTAAVDAQGYGHFTVVRGVSVRAQHFAWALERGQLPEAKKVLQRCGDRRCVRFDHLYLGVARDGSAARRRPLVHGIPRRRGSPRVRRELAVLCAADVRTVQLLHALGGRATPMAQLLGVDEATIRAILRRPR
jgi:hypothetical protein